MKAPPPLVVASLFAALLSSIVSPARSTPAAPPKSTGHPIARGTFLQEYLARDWTDAQWQAEFRYLREVGMEYLVFGSTADSKARITFYPTSLPGYRLADGYGDTVDTCLRNAEEAGFKVFLGLNFNGDWWQKGANDPEWLLTQMREGNALADELWARYSHKYPKAFYGWYWGWEVDNANFRTPETIQTLARALDTSVQHLKTLTPSKPVMLCPFMNYRLSGPEAYRAMWTTVFARCALGAGDIFCPQDCVGAGGLRLDDVAPWFAALGKAVATKPGLRFWSDTETFVQEDWTSAPIGRFIEQMRKVQPYVETCITFAYSHYYSPNTVGPGFHRTYAEYVRTGKLDAVPPSPPSDLRAEISAPGRVRLSWRAATDDHGVCGYYVYRDGKLISRKQIGKDKNPPDAVNLELVDEKAGDSAAAAKYTIQAYDFAGNISATVGSASPR